MKKLADTPAPVPPHPPKRQLAGVRGKFYRQYVTGPVIAPKEPRLSVRSLWYWLANRVHAARHGHTS
jgi:hypothetical protein